jgi:DNA-binding beta-propeller fold protein YncE
MRIRGSLSRAVAPLAVLVLAGCGHHHHHSSTPVVSHLFFGQDSNANGLFELDRSTGTANIVGAGSTSMTSSTNGLTETPNPAILLGSVFNPLVNIASDGSGSHVISGSADAEGLGMDFETGIIYATINNAFFTVHPVTGVNTGALAGAPNSEGLAADPATGLIYAVGPGGPDLSVYNPGTNTWSTVGTTGVAWLDPGMAFDSTSGFLYAVDNVTDSLYRINPANASTVLVGPLGTNGGGGVAFVED